MNTNTTRFSRLRGTCGSDGSHERLVRREASAKTGDVEQKRSRQRVASRTAPKTKGVGRGTVALPWWQIEAS